MIAGGYDDAVTAFTSVAARKFASPSCQQLRALSSRFSGSGCPEAEGTRLSGERVITRADSFHSASTSTSPSDAPLDIPFSYRNRSMTVAARNVDNGRQSSILSRDSHGAVPSNENKILVTTRIT